MVLVDLVKRGRAFQKKKKQKDSLVDRRKMTDDVEVDNKFVFMEYACLSRLIVV